MATRRARGAPPRATQLPPRHRRVPPAFSPAIAVDTDKFAPPRSQRSRAQQRYLVQSPMVSLPAASGSPTARASTRATRLALNGAQLLATEDGSSASSRTQRTRRRPPTCAPAARAEERMLTVYAGALAANQTLDFGSRTDRDRGGAAGERRAPPQRSAVGGGGVGAPTIPRRVALIPCVSNFSHFLDMCRKGPRLLELGVPVMVLARTLHPVPLGGDPRGRARGAGRRPAVL